MISRVMKKMSAIMMVVVLIMTSVPMQAFAAQEIIKGVSVDSGTVSNGTLTLTAEPEESCDSYSEGSSSATLTIETDATLSFDYSVSGASAVTIDGKAQSTSGGTFVKPNAKGKITVKVTCPGTKGAKATLKLSNFKLEVSTVKRAITIVQPTNGSITVDGAALTPDGIYSVDGNGITLKATTATGATFYGWAKVEGENLTIMSQNLEYKLIPTEDCTIKAVFLQDNSEETMFKVGTRLFSSLKDASDYAESSGSTMIVPIKSGVVPSGDYEIPSGVTLLVPFNQAETCYRAEQTDCLSEGYTTPTVFRKLTLADGAKITVNGEISVSARSKDATGSNVDGAAPTGPCGFLELNEGSQITLGKGGKLYAWGFVIGKGRIIADDGSEVYENMQIADFRGGNGTKAMAVDGKAKQAFPFSEYYVQNIEVPITYKYGATEYAVLTIYAQRTHVRSPIKFVGTSGAMFNLNQKSSTMTKTYIPSEDRIQFDIDGDLLLGNIKIQIKALLLSIDINSADFNLAMNGNMRINLNSGTLSVGQNIALHPGSEINVAEGAKIHINKGIQAIIYDRDQWLWVDPATNKQCGYIMNNEPLIPIIYSPSRPNRETRTVDSLKDVTIDINGVLECEGAIYTTGTAGVTKNEGGASIISSQNTGVVKLSSAVGTKTYINQFKTIAAEPYVDNGSTVIPITAAKLQNADGSYVESAGSKAGTYFIYDKNVPGADGKNGKWVKVSDTKITFDANGGTGTMAPQEYKAEDVKGTIQSGSRFRLNKNIFTKFENVFTGWNTAVDGTGVSYEDEANVDLHGDITLYAQWKANEYTVNFHSNGGSEVSSILRGYGTALTELPTPIRDGYTFEGWYTVDGDVKVDGNMTMPSGGIDCYAQWSKIQYSIGYDLDGGSLPDGKINPEGYNVESEDITLINPTKTGYTFIGWIGSNGEIAQEAVSITKGSTGDKTYIAQWSINQYEITFELENGQEAIKIKQDYNTEVIAPEDPTRDGYTFAGWNNTIPETMPAVDTEITAIWTANTYDVKFNGNGATGGEMNNQGFTYDVAQNLNDNKFERVYNVTYNYNGNGAEETAVAAEATFNGWATTADGDKVYDDMQEVNNLATEGTFNLYANWTLEAVQLPTPERTGYQFAGWIIDGDESGTVYNVETPYTPEDDVTFVAQWTANTYKVQFDGNGATSGEMEKQIHTYDAAQSLTENAFDRRYKVTYNYNGADGNANGDFDELPADVTAIAIFNGWRDADGNAYGDKASVENLTAEKDEVVTLVADWTLETVTLPTPTKTGYNFAGWKVVEQNTRTALNAGAEFTPVREVTLDAQWNPIVYAIEYNLDTDTLFEDGVLTEGSPENYTIETGFTLKAPTKTGYTFIGWTGSNGDEKEMTVTVAPGEIGDKEYTANWEINTHTVTYYDAEGNVQYTEDLEYAQEIPKHEQPETVSHIFGGWYITLPTEGTPGVLMPVNMPDKDLDVYAHWVEKKEVTVDFNTDGGSEVEPLTSWVGAPLELPAAPTKTGHTFTGWYTAAGEDGEKLPDNPRYPFDDATYYAHWSVNSYEVSFDSVEGTAVEPIKVKFAETVKDKVEGFVPVKPGYTFQGWDNIPETMPAEDIELKAIWKENQRVTVTFKDHKGHTIDEFTDLHGKAFAYTEVPTRTGYTFTGWDQEIPEIYPAEDMTINAQWQINQYTITFNTDGGSVLGEIEQDYDTAITAPENPTKEGYDFVGWYDVDDEERTKVPETMPARDMNLKALWEINQYEITFDTDGGSKVKPIIEDYGTAITAPKEPKKAGYTFVGWEPALPETMPAGDMTVKAIWQTISYAIEYDLDGGSLPEGHPTSYTVESEDFSLMAPTKKGYTFKGWTGSNGLRAEKEVIIEQGSYDDLNFTAKWTANEYDVQFNGNDATSGDMDNQVFTYDDAQNLKKNDFERKYAVTYNYNGNGTDDETVTATATFNGWAETADGEVKYADKEEVSNLAPEGTFNLYANWTLGTVDLPTPKRPGYTFEGWTTDVEGKEAVEHVDGVYTPEGDITLYAKWTANDYKVQFNGNGATSGEMGNQPFTYDVPQNLTENAFGREYVVTYNYNGNGSKDTTAKATATFDGWAETADGEVKYADQEEVSNLATEGIFNLYAHWTLGTVNLPTPERTGYTFVGWTTDVEGKEAVEHVDGVYTPVGDITLYAQWTANKYQVQFNGNGATSGDMDNQAFTYDVPQNLTENAFGRAYDVTYNYNGNGTDDETVTATAIFNGWAETADGDKVYEDAQEVNNLATEGTFNLYANWTLESVTLPTPERTGYTFVGWTADEEGEGTVYEGGAVYTPAGDITLYAQWTINAYKATFDANGGKTADPESITKDYDTELGELPTTERAGYTFVGWFTAAAEGTEITAETKVPAKDVTYYAQWNANAFDVSFDGNGATSGEMANQAFTYDVAQNLAENAFGREYDVTYNYNGNGTDDETVTATATFNGWAESADGDKVYEDAQEVSNLATEGTYELYANWTLGTVELPAPERTGYTFVGWTADEEGEGTVYKGGEAYTPVKATTLYAQWTINAYEATFDANGGSDAVPGSITKDYDTELGQLPTTVRAGYTFNGWFTAAEEGEEITAESKMPAEDVTYYAQWTINKHTITFDAADGSEPVVITKEYGTEVTVLEEPGREGYTFKHWNTEADGSGEKYKPGDKVTLKENVELFAQWDVNQYKMTFDANGGSDVEPITQDYGTEVTAPADPTRKGYTFAGWDGDIPTTMPAEDLTFTAKWNINQYTVTFESADGSGYKDTIKQDYDTDVTVLEAPVREGYTFKTWNTEADGSGKDYKPGKTLRLEDNDVTLYAQWQINQYTITFDADGGSDVEPITLDYGTEVKAPKEPAKYGYAFAGWEPALPETMPAKDIEVKAQWVELEKYTATFKDHNGNTIDASTGLAGEQIPVPADPTREGYTFAGWTPEVPEFYPEANTTYTAQWTVNEYTATFDANDGNEATPKTITKDYGKELGKLPETSRTGYTFKGWFTEKTGGTKITDETTMPAGDVTYYAQWAINTYAINFDTVGGSAVDQIVQEFGTDIVKPEEPTKEGHTFAGWDAEVPTTMPANNLTLIAQWLVNQYTIIFDTDGGSDVDPITQDYGTEVVAPENPTKKGHSFAGWDSDIPTTMPAENKTVKATWQINKYTIAFNTAGGNAIDSITQEYGTAITAPADPVREEYAFVGWDVEIPATMPEGDMTINAQWNYIYTGWKTTDEGTTYFENGQQPYRSEWAEIDGESYYFDENSYLAKGVTDTDEGIHIFDEETGLVVEAEGIYEYDGDIYLMEDNKVVENAGLVKIGDDYYYFGEDNKAVKDQEIELDDTNDLLPEGIYVFGPDGKLLNAPIQITEDKVKLEQDSVVYDGSEQTPEVVVEGFGEEAYEVVYADNVHAGTATVTVTGVNGCFGTVTLYFEIQQAENDWMTGLTMDGWTEGEEAAEPFAEAEFGEVIYLYYADEDCTEEIDLPEAAGTYYVKAYVEGNADYAGLESEAIEFVIEEAEDEFTGEPEEDSDKEPNKDSEEESEEDSPTTGDETPVGLWLSLAMASMISALSLYRRRRDEM